MATESNRPFAKSKFSKGNPLAFGSCHAKVFEMLLRPSGCTTKDIERTFESNGIIWSGYGVILSHFKQSRYRPAKLGDHNHPIYARATGETRDGRPVFRLWHSKLEKWLTGVDSDLWGFPVSAKPKPKAKPKASRRAKAKVKRQSRAATVKAGAALQNTRVDAQAVAEADMAAEQTETAERTAVEMPALS